MRVMTDRPDDRKSPRFRKRAGCIVYITQSSNYVASRLPEEKPRGCARGSGSPGAGGGCGARPVSYLARGAAARRASLLSFQFSRGRLLAPHARLELMALIMHRYGIACPSTGPYGTPRRSPPPAACTFVLASACLHFPRQFGFAFGNCSLPARAERRFCPAPALGPAITGEACAAGGANEGRRVWI